jgi:Zn-dependent M16 (insulinase) family peptidase
MLPDKSLAAQREAAEKERLAAVRAAMGPEDVEAVIKETKELKERQVRCSRVLKCCGFMHKVANA